MTILTAQQEAFAQAYVELDNASAAYRRVYANTPNTKRETIWANASREISHPDIARRIRELRDAAAAGAVVRAVDLMRDWYDIATADPNEIVSVLVESCRHCHGIEHAYHWVDEQEYARAYDVIMNAPRPKGVTLDPVPPDMTGGFGFSPSREPAPDCPQCFGKGAVHVTVHDTTKLSPAARKLYKGAKQDRYGCVEVLMHDQEAAREKLGRMLGAFKDGVGVPGVPLPERDGIKAEASDEEAAKRYLQMVQK